MTTYTRRSRAYGGDLPPGHPWRQPAGPQDREATVRALHRPHEARLATRLPGPGLRAPEGYLAPVDGLLCYEACRQCNEAWPCPRAGLCKVDGEQWPCSSVRDLGVVA